MLLSSPHTPCLRPLAGGFSQMSQFQLDQFQFKWKDAETLRLASLIHIQFQRVKNHQLMTCHYLAEHGVYGVKLIQLLFSMAFAPGVPDYTVAYANNMFVFENEDNMKAFMKDPKKYLKAPPKMPKEFRMLILGPRGMGMHT